MEKAELHLVIKECLRNNKIHQKKLYKTFYGFAYSIALRYAGGGEEASVIMNKGFYNVFAGLSNYDKTSEFKEWLKYHILIAAIEYLFMIRQLPAMLIESKTSDSNPVSDNLGTGLSYDEKIQMLNQLPYRCRAVFNLFAIDGYEHERISDMLHISVDTSRLLLAQARESLNYFMSLLS
ncbi:RNA polymerase sigma factor [Mucilaginibacter angelicae]|uniref:RNA polymerase sigma factor n=1 Tax=Mucilaginibacter angelicae TaxID=869718 RepID=A0ABV6L468_9SPHI